MSNPESLLSLVSLLNYLEITDAHVCTKFGVSWDENIVHMHIHTQVRFSQSNQI